MSATGTKASKAGWVSCNTTFESLAQSAVQFANRTDLAIFNDEVQQGHRKGAFEPWVATQVRLGLGGRVFSLSEMPQSALAVDALGIRHSIADVELFMLASPAALAEDNATINLKIVTQYGNEIFFKLRMNTQFVRLMYAFCHRQGISITMVRFLFDAQRVYPHQTPFVLDMEDGDVMDVMVEQAGD